MKTDTKRKNEDDLTHLPEEDVETHAKAPHSKMKGQHEDRHSETEVGREGEEEVEQAKESIEKGKKSR